jgi:hypothetical protein
MREGDLERDAVAVEHPNRAGKDRQLDELVLPHPAEHAREEPVVDGRRFGRDPVDPVHDRPLALRQLVEERLVAGRRDVLGRDAGIQRDRSVRREAVVAAVQLRDAHDDELLRRQVEGALTHNLPEERHQRLEQVGRVCERAGEGGGAAVLAVPRACSQRCLVEIEEWNPAQHPSLLFTLTVATPPSARRRQRLSVQVGRPVPARGPAPRGGRAA